MLDIGPGSGDPPGIASSARRDGDAPLAVVAGATGDLGRHVVAALRRDGWRVRALVRDAQRARRTLSPEVDVAAADLTRAGSEAALEHALADADAVVSCVGAPLGVRGGALADRRPFARVDRDGNLRLVAAARAAGARRLVYVSVAGGRALRHTRYVDAHEAVVDAIAAGRTPYAIVRPTGFFSAFDEVVHMALAGRAVVVGDGSARTNPIHPADVADVCAAAAAGGAVAGAPAGATDVPVGGPTTLTRADVVRLAFAAAGRPAPRVRPVPPSVLRGMARLLAPVHPRLAAVIEFGAAISVVDAVAPAFGTRELADHFAERVVAIRGASSRPSRVETDADTMR